ncbi:UDP-3-O-acyl-N-acetylglucosamine deacetylase [candidate division WOR-3 bacterium]|nr:UDP-3-O-acyl-N-acetylglucosamine deacetylase [candidate division WOR-3 bacterium]
MANRKTIKNPFSLKGVGLHGGKNCEISVFPHDEEGILFISKREKIKASFKRADTSRRCTSLLGKNTRVEVVEHLMSSFFLTGVTDAVVEVKGEEIPFLDGSAAHFVEAIEVAGVEDKKVFWEELEGKCHTRVANGVSEVFYSPWKDESLLITVLLSFPEEGVKCRHLTFEAYSKDLKTTIARARTFAFEGWVEDLKTRGLIEGGSLENALVLKYGGEPVEGSSCRFEDEFVSHKALDLLGDLMLSPKRLKGRIFAVCPGHKIHLDFLREIFSPE